MSQLQIEEGSLLFSFPSDSTASKYDDWSFYRNQFNSMFGGTKAVDLLFVESQIAWLIEIKDYRVNQRTKPTDLGEEIALKVRDTLAGLVAAKCNANDQSEKQLAAEILQCSRVRVVLHLEQPANRSKLFPKAIAPANVKQKLKQLLKAIDAHPLVVDKDSKTPDIRWMVTSI